MARQALLGEKPLRPKVLRSLALQQELEALSKACAQMKERVSQATAAANGSGPATVPKEFEAGTGEMALAVPEWVRRFIQHEESLKHVPPTLVSEACKTVMGNGNQVFDLRGVKVSYAGVLYEVHRLLEERVATVQAELDRLEQEVALIEDHIAICFEKMDDAGDGEVTRERFIACVCGEGEENQSVIAIRPEDVENLFDKMSKGKQAIAYEEFKDGITFGCLQILRSNFDLQSSVRKKFRDFWF